MNIILISSLLGVAALVLQAATSKAETLKVSVSARPPGSNIYLGESVLLQCTVKSNTSFVWRYQWFRQRPHRALTPNPRHLVSGDSYSIKAVTREDAGGYQCQAEPWESSNSTSGKILSEPVELSVLELPPSALTLTPNTRQLFRGERFTVQCPESRTNSSGWMLKHFPSSRRDRKRVLHPDQCSPLGGAVSEDNPDACAFTAVSANGGLYWCQGPEGRSNSVNITVSLGPVILKTPAFPVLEGDEVILSCQYLSGTPGKTTFFKNGAEMNTSYSSASSNRVIKMTVENVTQDDEGFYKCASQDGKMESPESWLSVIPDRGNLTTDGTASTSGSWKWILVSCGLLLCLIPLTVWLVRHYRYQTFCTRSCWPVSKEALPAVELPVTKQDATEVQWDLSWMEMSNLLDKQLYPGT